MQQTSKIQDLIISTLLPLAIGLFAGSFLIRSLYYMPTKWVYFIVLGISMFSVCLLIGLLTPHLKKILLTVGVAMIPSLYDINFQFVDEPLFHVLVNGYQISFFDLILGVLYAIWVYEFWAYPQATPSIRFPKGWLFVLMAMLVLNLISAMFVADVPFFSYNVVFVQVKSYLAVFYLVNNIRDKQTFKLVAYALGATLILQAVVVLEQKFIGAIFTDEMLGRRGIVKTRVGIQDVERVAGTLAHPNALAMYINLILPMVFYLFLMTKKLKPKFFLGIMLFSGLVVEIWTSSRGGWVGLTGAMGICTYLWFVHQGKNPVIGLGYMLVVMSLAFTVLFFGSSSVRDRLTKDDGGTGDVRDPLMQVAKEVIKAHPLLGVGLNNYTNEMVYYDRTNDFIASNYGHAVHNTFLLMWAEAGVFKLLFFVIFLGILFKSAVTTVFKHDNIIAAISLGSFGGLLAWSVHNQVNLSEPFADSVFWVLVGLIGAAQFYQEDDSTKSQETA